MKAKLLALGTLTVLGLSACSTMYFTNGNRSTTNLENGEWHHDGVLRLVEFSPPVDLAQRCEGEPWKAVKIERTFLNAVAASVTYNLYDPWEVHYSCGQ